MHMYVWGNEVQYNRPWGPCFLHLLLLVSEYSSKSTTISCLSLIGFLQAIYLIHHFNSKFSKHVTWNMYNKPLQPWNVSQYWSATCPTLASRNMHWPGFFEWPTNPQQTNQKDRTQTKPTSFPSQLLTSKQLLFPQEVPQAKITVPSTIHPTIFCIFSQCFFFQRTGGGASHLQYLRDDLDWLSRRVARLMASKNEASPGFRKALAHSGRRTWRTSRCRVYLGCPAGS